MRWMIENSENGKMNETSKSIYLLSLYDVRHVRRYLKAAREDVVGFVS